MSSLGGPSLPGHQKGQSTKYVGPASFLTYNQASGAPEEGDKDGNCEKVKAGNTDRARPILDTSGSHGASQQPYEPVASLSQLLEGKLRTTTREMVCAHTQGALRLTHTGGPVLRRGDPPPERPALPTTVAPSHV